MLSTTPLQGPFGVEVLGIDFSQPHLDDSTVREYMQLFYKHQVVRVRSQRLSPENFERYGAWLGEPRDHFSEKSRMPGHPRIGILTNDATMRTEVEYNTPAFWHTDNSYYAVPACATTLYPVEVPEEGGATLISDMITAFADLPVAMRKRIENMTIVCRAGDRDSGKGTARAGYDEKSLPKLPPAMHPLVRTHPVTGRKALYSVAGLSHGIVGMPDDEALDLLAELKRHSTQPQYVLSLRYEIGELTTWDNYSTMHSASVLPPGVDKRTLRRMWRISVAGLSPLVS